MKKLLFFISFISSFICYSQKTPLNIDAINKWQSVLQGGINDSGDFVYYVIKNSPIGSQTVVFKSIKDDWKFEVPGGSMPAFIDNSELGVYSKGHDSLCIVSLGQSQSRVIPRVKSYKLSSAESKIPWLSYLKSDSNVLVTENLESEKITTYTGISDYYFDSEGTRLVLVKKNTLSIDSATVINVVDGKRIIGFEGPNLSGITFHDNEIFYCTSEQKAKEKVSTCWILDDFKKIPTKLFDDDGLNEFGLKLSGLVAIDKKSKYLFFSAVENDNQHKDNVKGVDIWNFSDTFLQSQQLNELHEEQKSFLCRFNFSNHTILRIQHHNEQVIDWDKEKNIVVNIYCDGNWDERTWNNSSQMQFALVSVDSGMRNYLPQGKCTTIAQSSISVSPDNSYAVFYDAKQRDYFSYQVSTGKLINLTSHLNVSWLSYSGNDMPYSNYNAWGVAGWIDKSNEVLIYDRNDIWKIDASGKKDAVCVTNRYGLINSIVFRFCPNKIEGQLVKDSDYVLSAFNVQTKENGFYRIKLDEPENPLKLSMGAYVYCVPEFYLGNIPIKAAKRKVFLVERQSSESQRNYYVTTDFIEFFPITNLNYGTDYNLVSAELVQWKDENKRQHQGVLYKPENFDPKKQYPLIFVYYDKRSQELNLFQEPGLSGDGINIPYFVSNGYLTCAVDIDFTRNDIGKSIETSILSAVDFLKTKVWINGSKLAINGHSFGGFETNYLITHSKIFAAALSSSGYSDLVADYGSTWGLGGDSRQEYYELRRMRMGASLWSKQEQYLGNSPVLTAYKVETPLLMMNNKNDQNVPFSQGVEFFTALRRLGKRAWMLQYDNGGHSLYSDKDAMDFTTRTAQFFNHYLKDSACPRWMLYGIAAKDKGTNDGFDLIREKDPKTGKWLTPKEGGLLTDEEKKKVEALKHRKPITITIE